LYILCGQIQLNELSVLMHYLKSDSTIFYSDNSNNNNNNNTHISKLP